MSALGTLGKIVTAPITVPVNVAGDALGAANDAAVPDTKHDLSTILSQAGWGTKNSTLNKRARSVVRRESGGDPTATNPSGAMGLFQVMTPLHCGNYGLPNDPSKCVAALEDPHTNAMVARMLYATAGWSPWATSGPIPPPETTWDPSITTAHHSVTGTAGDAVSAVVSPITDVAKAGTELIGALLSADTWFRIGKTVLGVFFIQIGAAVLLYIAVNEATNGAAHRNVVKAATTAALA